MLDNHKSLNYVSQQLVILAGQVGLQMSLEDWVVEPLVPPDEQPHFVK